MPIGSRRPLLGKKHGAGVDRLRQFEDVICGGYYFVPAVRHRRQPWSWILPEMEE